MPGLPVVPPDAMVTGIAKLNDRIMTQHTTDRVAEGIAQPGSGEENPRAFVTASGFLLQVLGGFLTFSACLAWAISAMLSSSTATPAPRWTDHLTGPQSATALVTLGLFTSLVGGLGLLAAGVGMQGEKKGSALTGLVMSSLMALVYVALAVLLIASAHRFVLGGAALLCGILSGGAAVLATISHATLKRSPPPGDYNLLTAEIVEEIRRKRDERRKEFDL